MTEDSYPRQAARTRNFRLGAPRQIQVSPDGARVAFIRSNSGTDPVGALRVIDVASATERLLADPADLSVDGELPAAEAARRERMREVTQGITAYDLDEAGNTAVFALDGNVYTVDIESGQSQLIATGGAIDPRLSPDGRDVAYVKGGALHLAGVDDRVLIGSDAPDRTHGSADFIAAEELDRARGFWWAPDSTALLVQWTDEAPVQMWWISDPAHPEQPPKSRRYPAAGTANAMVGLDLVGLDGSSRPVEWDRAQYPYLADVSWTAYGDPLAVLLDRSQRTRLALAIDPATAATREVARHCDPHWLTSSPGQVRWAPAGRLLSVQPDPDTDTYRLFADDVALTAPGLQVAALTDVLEGQAIVLAQQDPTTCRPFAVSWTGGVQAAGSAHGWHGIAVGGETTVLTHASLELAQPVSTVHRGDGSSFAIESVAEIPLVTLRYQPGETLRRFGDRELVTAVVFPRDHESGSARLPVLLSPYGGPGHARVAAAAHVYGEDQWLADQGFAVVIADGRGTPGRGPAWERSIADDLAGRVLQDQVDALTAALEHYPSDLDPSRVAIRGWSFGGYLAALAVLRRPDVFHAAVAGAPVTEWRWYDTAYTERYLGHPHDRPDAYEAASLLPRADQLRRPLLLIHGLTDDNVYAAHTLALSGALTAAGRLHSVLPLSGITHMAVREDVAENLLLLEVDFLRGALRDPTTVG